MKLFYGLLLVCVSWTCFSNLLHGQAVESVTPLERLLAPQSDREPEIREQVASDVAAWQDLSADAYLKTIEQWFPKGRKRVLNVSSSTAMSMAAEKLLVGDAVQASPSVVNRLYAISLPRLTSPERVKVQDRFLDEGAWKSLSATEFLKQATALIENDSTKGSFLRGMTHKAAAQRLQADDLLASADPEVVTKLYEIGKSQINNDQREAIQRRLIASRKLAANASFDALQELHALTGLGRGTLQNVMGRRRLIAEWLTKQKILLLSTPQLEWCLWNLRPTFPWDTAAGTKVTWSGNLKPRRNGEYRFSISPLDLSYNINEQYLHQAMRVWIDGQLIIDAASEDDSTPEDWQSESQEVRLQRGSPVSIKVEFDYAYQDNNWFAKLGAPILFWEGPGVSKQVVPPAALETAEGKQGLDVNYSWTWEGQAQQSSGVEPTIEAAWKGAPILGHENRKLRQRLAEEIASRQMSTESLASCNPEEPNSHPLCGTGEKRKTTFLCLESTDCAGRERCIKQMSQSSEHWTSVDQLVHMFNLYRLARAGVEEDALDIILSWAAAHPNYQLIRLEDPPERLLSHRNACRGTVAVYLISEYDGDLDRLEAEGLEDDQGRCNLPIACMCSYAYRCQNRLADWIVLLEEKLADKTLTGDRRVNWLIARAMAEEVQSSLTVRHYFGQERLLAGRQWLDEAVQVATSDEARLRALTEILTRQATLGQQTEALQLLETESANIQEAVGRQLQELETAIQELVSHHDKLTEEDAKAARAAYWQELKTRQAASSQAGDTMSANRYSKLLGDAEVQQDNGVQ